MSQRLLQHGVLAKMRSWATSFKLWTQILNSLNVEDAFKFTKIWTRLYRHLF